MVNDNVFYIVKGCVSDDPDVHQGTGAQPGDVEWQISDGPAGKRASSYDFVGSLDSALAEVSAKHPGCSFVWGEE